MLFILDLDRQKLVSSAGNEAEMSGITGKRSSVGIIAVQLVQAGVLVEEEMAAGFALKFTAKTRLQFDEDPQATTTDFTWHAATQQYRAAIDWITTALNDLFGIHADPVDLVSGDATTNVITATAHGLSVGDRVLFPTLTGGTGITAGDYYYVKTVPSADTFTISATSGGTTLDFTTTITAGTVRHDEEDVAEIDLGIELGWKHDSGDNWSLSENQVTLTLLNNYIRDDDGAPADPGDAASEAWLNDRAVRYDQDQALTQASRIQVMENTQLVCDALTGGAAGALDGIVTASGAVTTGRVVMAVISSVLSCWQIQAGTSAEDVSGGIVRPDDYDGSTNARVWVRVM